MIYMQREDGPLHPQQNNTVGAESLVQEPYQAETPANVADVNTTAQNETSVTLLWDNIREQNISYELEISDGTNRTIPVPSYTQDTVSYVVSPLDPGTKYNLTLFTVLNGIRSSGLSNILAITRPLGVSYIRVTEQKESSIKLQWNRVNGSEITYNLRIIGGEDISINQTETWGTVTHTITNLTAGVRYNLTLSVVFENVSSVEKEIHTVTAPRNVNALNVTERTDTSVTLSWFRPSNGVSGYELNFTDDYNITLNYTEDLMIHVVSLEPGKQYNFTLFTVFDGVRSSGHPFFTVTKIICSGLTWVVTNTSIQANIDTYNVTGGTAYNRSYYGVPVQPAGGMLSFKGLSPGSTYNVALWFNQSEVQLDLCTHTETLGPPDLKDPVCYYKLGGYAFGLSWDASEGLWTGVEVNVTGQSPQLVNGSQVMVTVINGVQPAQTYQVTLASISGHRLSNAVSFSCQTDPRGVIAGSILAVILFCILVCLAFFIWRRKPAAFSRPASIFVESKLVGDTFKLIPLGKFPDHYQRMSADTNRGFSEEYEDFQGIGQEQTRKVSEMEENKCKNRFGNVYPYDWCRVKLTTSKHNASSDYINANYMPGYSSTRQYIAAQGPLPNTVVDFWRMLWEQRVKGIVMVTNCIEGGRVKCEQYWPLDYTPCMYGELLVTVSSEKNEPSWTLREFVVKNRNTSEQRLIKHFHFTAWPDHGVPEGTRTLIQFRQLVRHYIEEQPDSGPTVVHCSAGVGRTGTIITLDVILQQLERERAVGIAAFVHKLRLSRPLMVQTEQQYVFLHQCIMDYLESTGKKVQEPIYENTDMIYSNATALKEF
ncbi:hypothetical protein DPEC_G00356070 [Dallia pectoralis]|uniref:Uncharacterized protein n=1 Tax=Dallia pectoralis TaxID=75939 RepID=A0ACC2EZL9_DALPE|nr:hypothetical protein DPEC_G00356070 [Dallia pectoralis]